MLDGLVGRAFEVVRPNDEFSSPFTITAVNGNMALIVSGENQATAVSVWSVMRALYSSSILAEVPPATDSASHDRG